MRCNVDEWQKDIIGARLTYGYIDTNAAILNSIIENIMVTFVKPCDHWVGCKSSIH